MVLHGHDVGASSRLLLGAARRDTAAVSPQAELIVGDQSGAIHIWDLKTDHNEQLIPEPEVSVNSVHIDPDASYMAAVNSSVSSAGVCQNSRAGSARPCWDGVGKLGWFRVGIHQPGHRSRCVSAGKLLRVEPDGRHRRGGDAADPQDQDPGTQPLRPAVQVQPRLHVSGEPLTSLPGQTRAFLGRQGSAVPPSVPPAVAAAGCTLRVSREERGRRQGMWHRRVAVSGVPLMLPDLSKVCSHELFYNWDPAAAKCELLHAVCSAGIS